MGQETEAEFLLRTGAAYPRRVGLRRREGGALVFAGFKPGGFSLYFGDAPYTHFDLEGRWQRALREGVHYLKGLDGAVEAVERERGETGLTLMRRGLSFAEAADLDGAIRGEVLELIEGMEEGELGLEGPEGAAREIGRDGLREMLDRIVRWDDAEWFRQRERYLGTYGPVGFLPPSCPAPIVLEGSVRAEAAGGFEPGETALRTVEEFGEHARAVKALLGRRAAQARGVVIQHGDFWNQPAEVIGGYLEVATEVFPVVEGVRPRLSERPMDEALVDGVYGFVAGGLERGPDGEGWRELAKRHLKRVDVGVRLMGGSGEGLRRLVGDLKAAGIGVGVVLAVGADEASEAETLVDGLGLGSRDHVYVMEAGDEVRTRLMGTRPRGGYRVVGYSEGKQ